jgi:hypothetical protein
MAEYRPLLIRAISRLDTNTPEARESVYATARAALDALITSPDHSRILEDEHDRERRALEEAIAKVEFSMIPQTANPSASSARVGKDGRACVQPRPDRAETGVLPGRKSLSDVPDNERGFGSFEPDAQQCMETLATIVTVVSQEMKEHR